MPPRVIADSDDEDGFEVSPVKAASRTSPTTAAITAPTTTIEEAGHDLLNPVPGPDRTDSADDLFFQSIYNEHNDAALRQFATQNNITTTTTAKMGQPSSRPSDDDDNDNDNGNNNSSGEKGPVAEHANSSGNHRQADTSSLSDPSHPSKHHKDKKSKGRGTSGITNVATPSRPSSGKVDFDLYAFTGGRPELETARRSKVAKTRSKTDCRKLLVGDETPSGTWDRQGTSHPSSVDLPSSFKKMRQELVPSLTHVDETSTVPFETTIIIGRTSSGSLVPPVSERSMGRCRLTDALSHVTETPENEQVDIVPATAKNLSSSSIGGAVAGPNFYIQPGTMTASQLREYQPVDPTPSLEADYGLPLLPTTGSDANQGCSGDVSTVAYTTPSRFQSTGPRVLPESHAADKVHQSSPRPPLGRKTKIVLKRRSEGASLSKTPTSSAAPTPFPTSNDVIMINSSPDEISNVKNKTKGPHGGSAVILRDLDEMPPQLWSVRGKKRQWMEDEDELSGNHDDELGDGCPAKRTSLTWTVAVDDANVITTTTAPLNDTPVAVTPTTPKTQKKTRGRKKKESVAVVAMAAGPTVVTGDAEVAQAAEKLKKKRGRPRKSGSLVAQDASTGASAAEEPLARQEAPLKRVETESKSDQVPRPLEDSVPAKADKALKETSANISRRTPGATNAKSNDLPAVWGGVDGTHKGLTEEAAMEKKVTEHKKKPATAPGSRYRVGLSRNARIQPLLKVIRK